MNEWSQFDSCYVKYPEANHQDLGPGDPGCWENRHGFTDFIAQDLDVYPSGKHTKNYGKSSCY